jgi:hypothetical protein
MEYIVNHFKEGIRVDEHLSAEVKPTPSRHVGSWNPTIG